MAPKRPRRNGRRGQLPSHVQRVPGPKTRLAGLFELIEEIYEVGDRELFGLVVPDDPDEARDLRFDAGILIRGNNALKVIALLCEQAHWEFAVSAARQLFEMVVNVEYLNAQPDRASAAFRFAKYGLLQMVLEQDGTLEYDERTGRTIDQRRREILEHMLERSFPEFRSEGSTGQVHWAKSWSGLSTRRLAELSGHRFRVDQYKLLYSAWSEQAHATPSVFLESIAGSEKSIEAIVADDDTRIAETMSMAITLYVELRRLLPHLPASDVEKQLEWTRRLLDEAASTRGSGTSPAPSRTTHSPRHADGTKSRGGETA